MADALCGPSNPVQSFQKHTSVDRTLQQDRLTSRYSPSQGFRSDTRLNDGLLDSEFEAFQAGFPNKFLENNLHNRGYALPPPEARAPPSLRIREPLGWASDFQRLNIAHSNFLPEQPQLRNQNITDWHQDFQAQNQAQQQAPVRNLPIMFSHQPRFGQLPSSGLQPQYNLIPALPQEETVFETRYTGKGKKVTFAHRTLASAFDKAFAAYADNELHQDAEKVASQHTELGQDVVMKDIQPAVTSFEEVNQSLRQPDAEIMHETTSLGDWSRPAQMHDSRHHGTVRNTEGAQVDNVFRDDQLRLHSGILQEETADQSQEQQPLADDDLAQTAGELLERVADNNTQKFQDSAFLSLMRRLRDREARVDGDTIVDTSQEADTTKAIPPHEQDVDLGKDARMTGALRPDKDFGQDPVPAAERELRPKILASDLFIPAWDRYGGHLIDDF